MPEDTIPRPIRFKFLEQAQEVCDLAKVDHWEHAEVLSSLREQLEASYRTYDQAGFYKDEAAAKALDDFGDVKAVASVHRDGWKGLWHRLLLYQRYSVHRLVAPVVFCMTHCYFRTAGSVNIKILASGDLDYTVALFGWPFYIGIFVIGLIGLARLAARILPMCKSMVEIIMLIVAIYLFQDLVAEWVESIQHFFVIARAVDDVSRWKNMLVGSIYLEVYVAEAVTFFFIFLISASEILDVSSRQRAVIKAKRKHDLASVDDWSWTVTNCFKWLSGQKSYALEKTGFFVRKPRKSTMALVWSISQKLKNRPTIS